jgi:hypothetical protein
VKHYFMKMAVSLIKLAMPGAWMAAALLVLPWAAKADYLRMVGPAPLRFEPAPVTAEPADMVTNATLLSLISPSETSTNVPGSAAEAASTNGSPGAVVTTVRSPSPAGALEGLPEFGPSINPADVPLVAPDAIWPLFQRGMGKTNGVQATAVAPVIFIPPTRATGSAASKATYSTP